MNDALTIRVRQIENLSGYRRNGWVNRPRWQTIGAQRALTKFGTIVKRGKQNVVKVKIGPGRYQELSTHNTMRDATLALASWFGVGSLPTRHAPDIIVKGSEVDD